MQTVQRGISLVAHFVHRYFLVLLVTSYVFAYFFPWFGEKIRTTALGTFHGPEGTEIVLTVSIFLLALLLFNGGLGLKMYEFKRVRHNLSMLTVGYLTNLIVPFCLVLLISSLVLPWSVVPQREGLIFGLALVVALPIAGASVAWSEDAEGNMALSLGFVLLSTLLSPITTPLILIGVNHIMFSTTTVPFFAIALRGIGLFLILVVVIPSFFGIFVNWLGKWKLYDVLKPYLKLMNFVNLLLLNYSNASVALPKMFSHQPWGFIVLVFVLSATLCILRFASGWAIGHITRASKEERVTLLFALGMNNNGSGLIFAAELFSGYLSIVLPVVFYTLVQQMTAALIDRKVSRWEAI